MATSSVLIPQAGQVAVRLTCDCKDRGTTLVRAAMVDDWRCGACGACGRRTGQSVTLGPGGSLPDGMKPGGWRYEHPLCVHRLVDCALCDGRAND